jgi:hypothetical protein
VTGEREGRGEGNLSHLLMRCEVFGKTKVDELQRTVRSFVFEEKVFKFEISVGRNRGGGMRGQS